VLPLVSPSPCMSIFSLQFAQQHNLGRSSCDAFGLAFTVHVQLQLTVVQKHNLGRSSCFASGLAFIVYVQLQAHSLLKNTIWGDPVGMASNENKAGYTQSPSMIRSVPKGVVGIIQSHSLLRFVPKRGEQQLETLNADTRNHSCSIAVA
jgi:hypothetical protein